MVLFFILVALLIGIPILVAVTSDDWNRGMDIVFSIILTFLGGLLVLVVAQGIGQATHTKTERIGYSIKIVSLNDGTGIKGQIYGGLFVTRGSINDTQHFSYYKQNDNGSYALEKIEASKSSIFLDATPEIAYIRIADDITTCRASEWWFIGCDTQTNQIAHADFHIPPNSIKEDYVLDAQ